MEYVLYDTTADSPDFMSFGGAPGEWLKAEDFFVLSAIDQSGREWTAEWVSADTGTTSGEPGAVVYGSLRELTCQFLLGSDRSHALLHGPASVSVPVNARTDTRITEAGRESRGVALDVWRSPTTIGELLLKKSGDVLRVRPETELLKDILAMANAWRETDAYILIGVKEISGHKAERPTRYLQLWSGAA